MLLVSVAWLLLAWFEDLKYPILGINFFFQLKGWLHNLNNHALELPKSVPCYFFFDCVEIHKRLELS